MAYTDEVKEAAQKLYLRGVPPKEIAEQLNLNSTRVIYNWAKDFGWAALLDELSAEQKLPCHVQLVFLRQRLPVVLLVGKQRKEALIYRLKLKFWFVHVHVPQPVV